MGTSRVQVTVRSGGYNNSGIEHLVYEDYPRWSSKYIEFTSEDRDVRMYIDYPFDATDSVLKPAKVSIYVLEEPYWCVPEAANFVLNHLDMFDMVFTNQKHALSLRHPKIRYYPGSFSHISPQCRYVALKTKNICGIFSTKSYAEGHQFRQTIKNDPWFHDRVDFVNSPVYITDKYEDKWNLLHPYRYNIAIENTFGELWTEKLLDCFLVGTIPIYKGNDRIWKYFNSDGFLTFSSLLELKDIVAWLQRDGEDVYKRKHDAIRENMEIAEKYVNLGDVLWRHGLKDLLIEKGLV